MKSVLISIESKTVSDLYRTVLVTVFIIGALNSFCQVKDSVPLSNRIKNLEDYKANLEQLYQINMAKLDTSLDAKINAKVKSIDEAQKTLHLLLWIGIPGTIIGLIVAYVAAVKKAKSIVFDKVEKIVEQKREEIIKLIETQEYDSQLRKKKKLLVLSPDEDSQAQITLFIKRLGFSEVKYRIVNSYQEFDDYDLIIFNDQFSLFPQQLMIEYLDHFEGEHISFVAFTKNKLAYDPRLNFSNSRFTLYHNILSTLKYAAILKLEDKY